MTQTVHALYENGILRLLEPLQGFADSSRVLVTVKTEPKRPHPLADCVGILPDEDAREMLEIIHAEFETVDADEWQ